MYLSIYPYICTYIYIYHIYYKYIYTHTHICCTEDMRAIIPFHYTSPPSITTQPAGDIYIHIGTRGIIRFYYIACLHPVTALHCRREGRRSSECALHEMKPSLAFLFVCACVRLCACVCAQTHTPPSVNICIYTYVYTCI
jgi:hypothetical protein